MNENQFRIMLAGATAEEIFMGERSTSSRSDLDQAVYLAETIIHAGMSPLGIVNHDTLPNEVMMRTTKELLDALFDSVSELLKNSNEVFNQLVPILLIDEKLGHTQLRAVCSITQEV